MPEPKFQQISQPVVDVYLSIEEQILINIAKKLKKHKKLRQNDIHAWQMMQLNELDSLTQENIRTIAQYAGMTMKEVTQSLKKAGYTTIKPSETYLQKAAAMGLLMKAPGIDESSAIDSILATYQAQARQTYNLINSTMLSQSHSGYIGILNNVVGKVLAGVQSPDEALRDGVREWAKKGIPALVDKAGREWSTEAYVGMVMRSMSNNIANDMQDARMGEYGVDLIEVSSHMGARPKCAPFQGKIYSMSGTSKKYPSFRITSYGQPDGLFGINCRHVKYPFVPGISIQRYEPYGTTENEESYQQSQKQRYLERRIRHAKRELSMMQALGDEQGINEAKRDVLDRQADMRQFIDDTGRTRQRAREQIHA